MLHSSKHANYLIRSYIMYLLAICFWPGQVIFRVCRKNNCRGQLGTAGVARSAGSPSRTTRLMPVDTSTATRDRRGILSAYDRENKTMKTDNEGKGIPSRKRSAQEALDECKRELHVRERCFPRWVAEGRVCETDAQDRIDRMASACELLVELVRSPGGGEKK